MRLESILYGTMALLFLSACSRLDQREPAPAAVNWQVIQDSPSTKASAYSTDNTFLAWAWYLPDGKVWSTDKSSAQAYIGDENGATIGYVSSRTAWKNVIWDGSSWVEGSSYYWPKAGKLTFFAASPSKLETYVTCDKTNGILISNWDVDKNQDVDVMVSDVVTDQTGNTSATGSWLTGVPTIFRHKLSKISGFTFNLQKDYANGGTEGNYKNGDITYLLKSVTIKNMPQKGSYVNALPSESSIGRWDVAAGGLCSYTWYNNDTGELIPYADLKKGETAKSIPANGLGEIQPGVFRSELYLLPQLFKEDGPTLEITYIKRTYTGKNTYTPSQTTASISFYDLFTATNHRLVINRDITFNIVFNNEANLITWAPDQQEWGSGDFKIDF